MSFRVQDPLALFNQWLEDATATEVNDPNAMALATLDDDGTLSNRIVLLKGHDDRGFRFFTNYEGRKGQALQANPRAAALFHWKTLDRQVRLEGPVERLSAEESQAYFDTRARGSRVGAWASLQSQPLPTAQRSRTGLQSMKRSLTGRNISPNQTTGVALSSNHWRWNSGEQVISGCTNGCD